MTAGSLAASLGGVALFALPGLGLAELLAPLRRLPLAHRLGYAWLLGVLAVGGALFAASHLLGVPLRRPAIAAAVTAPAALGLAIGAARRWPRRGQPAPRPPGSRAPRRRWHLAALAPGLLVAAACLGPLASALATPLTDWDGRIFWSAQAAYMRAAGTVDASVLQDAQWFIVHPRYPPLLPLAQVAMQETFGARGDAQYYRALYVAFMAALLLVIHDGAARAAGPSAATLATLCAALPPVLSYGSGGATSAYSDLALAAFYGGALVLLLARKPSPAAGLAAGCLLAGGLLAKNEGELLAVFALLLASFRLLRRGHRPAIATHRLPWFASAALPVLAAAALLASWRAAIPNREDEDYFAILHPAALLRGAFTRLLPIAREAARQTFDPTQWLGFWLVVLVVLLAGWTALRRPLVRRLAPAALAPLAIGWAAYSITPRLPILIVETWDRFLLQAYLPLISVFACTLSTLLPRPTARNNRGMKRRSLIGDGGLRSIGSPPATPQSPSLPSGGEGDAPALSRQEFR